MATYKIDINSETDVVKHLNILKGHLGIIKQNPSLKYEEVNYSSLESLKNLRGKLDIAINELKAGIPKQSSWDTQKELLDLYNKIWDSDLSVLFNALNLDNTPKYYVYAHTVSRKLKVNSKAIDAFTQLALGLKEKPFYIGKGTGNRYSLQERNAFYNKYRKQLISEGHTISQSIIKDNLTESKALELESKLIDIYGVKAEGGWLANLDTCYQPIERKKLYPSECLSLFSKYGE